MPAPPSATGSGGGAPWVTAASTVVDEPDPEEAQPQDCCATQLKP
jgi:hypothetical protein